MSATAVEAYRKKFAADAEFRRQVEVAFADPTGAELVRLGEAHGLEVTAEELAAVLEEGELSDLELELVSGGGSADCGTSSSTRG
ncbi:MAG: Nif11-like leader peptide family RiPP precursor [Planctomycetes bacterium]|nr:Nif11-like leader peptide family RiPP precursor [Planctomycetota bacterium]